MTPGDFAWWCGPRGEARPVIVRRFLYRQGRGRQVLAEDPVDRIQRTLARHGITPVVDGEDAQRWHRAVAEATQQKERERAFVKATQQLHDAHVPVSVLLAEMAREVPVEQFQLVRLAVLRVAYRQQARVTLGPDAGPVRVPDFLRSPRQASVTKTGEKE